ncbi:MAG: MFS transporter [Clostridiales bacterium]|nr:MFS transporter [Clostridiales bacterium]
MYSLLLVIIYIAFISLGLPDSLLGSGWPEMRLSLGVPLSYAGIVSMIIAGGTIVSSLLSDRLTRKLGAGLVTAVSVAMTAAALFGFSVSRSFWLVCLFAVPYGLGAGAVDAALNNYVALHYASRHMSWLHCFWGVGASISPYIMGYGLTRGLGWSSGYRTVFIIQIILSVVLFASLSLWKKRENGDSGGRNDAAPMGLSRIIRVKGVVYVLVAFFCYCAMETTAGLWASSYLVIARGISSETAARYASLFYLGITCGRFISGFAANKAGDKGMIRIGIGVILIGMTAVLIPFKADWPSLYGLVIIGLGCAPVYPSIIHSTPSNFGADKSQAIIGVQMASAYLGSTLAPPLFGLIANHIDMGLFPVYMLVFTALMLVMTEKLNRTFKLAPVTPHIINRNNDRGDKPGDGVTQRHGKD